MKRTAENRPAVPQISLLLLRRLARASLTLCAAVTEMKASMRADVYPKENRLVPTSKNY